MCELPCGEGWVIIGANSHEHVVSEPHGGQFVHRMEPQVAKETMPLHGCSVLLLLRYFSKRTSTTFPHEQFRCASGNFDFNNRVWWLSGFANRNNWTLANIAQLLLEEISRMEYVKV